MDMWVGTRSAWHSKSLERRCQTAVRMFRGSLASQPYFSSCACAGERGRGKGRKNTSGKMCKVIVPSAGMLAEPMKFQHSK